MDVVSPDFVHRQKVLLRLDIDVPIKNGHILDDYRLRVALPTLQMCAKYADQVVIMGHVGRPEGQEDPELSVAPIHKWLEENGFAMELETGQMHLLENLRFEPGEDTCDPKFAHQLARLGDVYVNEAFSAHHPAASTTIVPRLLHHAAGLHFAKEVATLLGARHHPKRPLIAIVGGAKFEDKYQAVLGLAKFCDKVLVGGLLATKIREHHILAPANVVVGTNEGVDLSHHTITHFIDQLGPANQVIWSGPVGKYEDPEGQRGNRALAEVLVHSQAETIVGGGDTLAALEEYLDKFSFVSVGGGAMLKLLIEGTLPTIEVLS